MSVHTDFEAWISTRDGKVCNDYKTLTSQEFLQNRLAWAFMAGAEYAETHKIAQMNKVINSAHRTIGSLRKQIIAENEAV